MKQKNIEIPQANPEKKRDYRTIILNILIIIIIACAAVFFCLKKYAESHSFSPAPPISDCLACGESTSEPHIDCMLKENAETD